jgi:hypothetical protein
MLGGSNITQAYWETGPDDGEFVNS